jgi:hypothetical protein
MMAAYQSKLQGGLTMKLPKPDMIVQALGMEPEYLYTRERVLEMLAERKTMTSDLRKAAEQAIESLQTSVKFANHVGYGGWKDAALRCHESIAALRAALAEPAQSEPVAWMVTTETQDGSLNTYPLAGRYKDAKDACDRGEPMPLFAAPPRREQQWIKTSEQYPPEGVRVFWFNPQTNQVGYDTWMGEDFRFNAEYWMHIPEIGVKP